MSNDTCTVGRIIKHRNSMVGFKLSFNKPELARKYKKTIIWYMETDDVKVSRERGGIFEQ